MKNKAFFSVKSDLAAAIDKVFCFGMLNAVNLTALSVSAGTAVFC